MMYFKSLHEGSPAGSISLKGLSVCLTYACVCAYDCEHLYLCIELLALELVAMCPLR